MRGWIDLPALGAGGAAPAPLRAVETVRSGAYGAAVPGFENDVVVVGGCGHVGLPLAIALAGAGLKVIAYDINPDAVELVRSATMPFLEEGGPERLEAVIKAGSLTATTDPAVIASAESIILVIGTPVDEHLNPDPNAVGSALQEILDHLQDGQLVILRSTIFPGVTRLVERRLSESGASVDLAFCPERIAEGRAFVELYTLPQIISGCSDSAVSRANKLFAHLTSQTITTTPEEAELAKLFTNTWRYVKFATANQFYMMANDAGVDYEQVRRAITFDYPRADDLPGAGFAAGPCLFKDTMQLAAFNDNNFVLGHSAMLVNEGLPLYVVTCLERRYDLAHMTVGILGMAFKAESDDTRSSLSYKLKRILRFKAGNVLTADPFVSTDPDIRPPEAVMDEADILIIGAPHAAYRNLPTTKPVVDIWDLLGRGVVI